MYVRRKSNWYIYFIAFGITLAFVIAAIFVFRWYLFPSDTQDTGINDATGELTDDFVPTPEHNFRLLTMISEGVNDSPEFFCLVEYNATENRLVFIPLSNGISIENEGRTLPNVYAAQGGAEVIKVVNRELDVGCTSFVKMDRQSFEDLIAAFGNVEYSLPRTVIINEAGEISTFNSGTHLLTPNDIYQLIVKADYEDGEAYRFKMAGDILSELINQNYNNVDSNLLDTYFEMIMRTSDTNLTLDVYKQHKAALLNTIKYGAMPADFYIPYGEYAEDGSFKVAENSLITIKQKAGLV